MNFFYVDSLSIIVLDIVLVIGFIVSIYSVGYLRMEIKDGKMGASRLGLYYILVYAFLFTMILALTVNNMGVMWIAIEATTLASVFLVGFQNDKHSLEAAWKYVMICSVGIAIALLGIILLHLSSINVLKSGDLLEWTALYANAAALKQPIARLAFLFILVGFGTKAGLAPMHTWLPDAHSQAPSPISALLSGVLLNSAMYGIVRVVAIVNRNLGSSEYTGRLLIASGLLSILTAAVFLLTQKDYKRLLAYSSVEHMGIIAIAIGAFYTALRFWRTASYDQSLTDEIDAVPFVRNDPAEIPLKKNYKSKRSDQDSSDHRDRVYAGAFRYRRSSSFQRVRK